VRPDKHGLRASATAAFVALPMVLVSAALIDVMALQQWILPGLTKLVDDKEGSEKREE
jgi:hypothetical protein